jgi:hypothetical protein
MNIEITDIYVRNGDQVTAKVDDEVVMMSMQQGEYYGLDSIGSRIWELFAKPNSVENIIGTLMQEYDVDRKTCEKDVQEFIQKLVDKGLLKISP